MTRKGNGESIRRRLASNKCRDLFHDCGFRVYIGQTVPFVSPYLLQIHFEKHRHDFGVADEQEYERLADRFMSQPPNADLVDGVCVNPRPNGVIDRVRLHAKTRWYGVAFDVLTVRTFFVKNHHDIREAGGPRAFVDLQCLEIF